MSKTILVDFDGVIHSYVSGWRGVDDVPDPPVPGAIEWIAAMIGEGYKIAIYSARSSSELGRQAMKKWFMEVSGQVFADGSSQFREFVEDELLTFPSEKPPSFLTIDDRCICFRGTFPSVREIESFRPWTKNWEGPGVEEKDKIENAAQYVYDWKEIGVSVVPVHVDGDSVDVVVFRNRVLSDRHPNNENVIVRMIVSRDVHVRRIAPILESRHNYTVSEFVKKMRDVKEALEE